MEIQLADKMRHFQTSIFNELSSYKKKKIAEGKEIIDLSVGSPDLAPPTFVMEEIAKYATDPSQYGYALTGIDELHQAIATYYEQDEVFLEGKKDVLVVMGSQDGLVHLPMALTNPGDVVLVPDPGYTAYETGISLADATPYPMPLKAENQFLPDLKAIPEDIREKAKVMILNFPGNPVPAMATEAFFKEVIAFARNYNIVVIHDFAYSELYYNEKPLSFLSIDGAKEVGVEFNSFSKSFNMAGCRIGYIAGNEKVVGALGRLKSNLDYGVFLPIQRAAIRALDHADEFCPTLRNVYKNRRDVLVDGLRLLGWNVASPKASMFIWAKVPDGYTSKDFTYKLIDEAGVVVVPGNAFGESGEGYVRIALVEEVATLQRVLVKLEESKLFTAMMK